MRLHSPAIPHGGRIPLKYVMKGASGENISPPLKWSEIPEGTQSLALVCVDTHPVAKNWIHWIIINIPPDTRELAEGASPNGIKPPAMELINSYGFKGYGGPQPPPGTGDHTYVFKLFALNVPEIALPSKPTYDQILKTIKPYLLAESEFVGYFGR